MRFTIVNVFFNLINDLFNLTAHGFTPYFFDIILLINPIHKLFRNKLGDIASVGCEFLHNGGTQIGIL